MPVTVKTFATSGEAASALSSDRGACYLGGGTLVMRALNEGDISISTVVRSISLDGQSIRETATRLAMSEGAVRVALHRGLGALAAKFGQPKP